MGGAERVVDEEIAKRARSRPARGRSSLRRARSACFRGAARRRVAGRRLLAPPRDRRPETVRPAAKKLAQPARDRRDREAGSGFPLGRPRWVARTTAAPRSSRFSNRRQRGRMRVSSATSPSRRGTLKSTRTSTRLPRTSASVIDRFRHGSGLRLDQRKTSLAATSSSASIPRSQMRATSSATRQA